MSDAVERESSQHDYAWVGDSLLSSPAMEESIRFVASIPFNWMVTLTFSGRVDESTARVELGKFRRTVARDVVRGHYVDVVAGGEQERGAWHWHVLLALPAHVTAGDLRAAWPRRWRAEVERVRELHGAVAYLAKHTVFDPPYVVCPRWRNCRRAKRGCTEASNLLAIARRFDSFPEN